MKKCFAILLLIASSRMGAQLFITPDTSAQLLAQKITGAGVTITNANLNCGPNAAGTFIYSGNSLGFSAGIILTTGVASDAANPGSNFASQQNNNLVNDADLMGIEPMANNDVCLLEFDIVPTYNNINISFVFGSEEYPEFVNSTFNDAFGFFLSGPDPSGGNYAGKNIAVIPNNTPVAINTINASLNQSWFYDNYTAPNNDIIFDGYTLPINTITPVVAGATYHLKLALADAADQAYDSGVFIRDSLFSKPMGINDPILSQTGIYPMPCHENITLNSSFSDFDFEIYNAKGEKIINGRAAGQKWIIPISDLPPGMYQIYLTNKAGKIEKARFLKE